MKKKAYLKGGPGPAKLTDMTFLVEDVNLMIEY